MELSFREWIWVASGLAVAGIFGHYLWLRWRSRRNRLRLEIDPTVVQASEVDELELLRGELPNGGARVVPGREAAVKETAGKTRQGRAVSTPTVAPVPVRTQPPIDAPDDRPPVLMDPVSGARRVEPQVGARDDEGEASVPADDAREADTRTGTTEPVASPAARTAGASDAAGAQGDAGGSRAPATRQAAGGERDARGAAGSANGGVAPAGRRAAETASAPAAAEAEDDAGDDGDDGEVSREQLIVMQVLARDPDGFAVGAVATRVTGTGMTFGDFNIFHRYKDGRTNRKYIEYSMANAVEPGVFDLSDGGARTRGVAFFMQLPVPSEPMAVFDDMLRVATDLANNVDGELRDDRHGVITSQTIEHFRERIREFNRRRQIRN